MFTSDSSQPMVSMRFPTRLPAIIYLLRSPRPSALVSAPCFGNSTSSEEEGAAVGLTLSSGPMENLPNYSGDIRYEYMWMPLSHGIAGLFSIQWLMSTYLDVRCFEAWLHLHIDSEHLRPNAMT